MKKIGSAFLLITVICFFSGCSREAFDATENTVYARKDAEIMGLNMEQFDKDYYDEAELEKMVKQEVSDYNTKADNENIAVSEYKVEEGTARLLLSYENGNDYAAFNGVTFYNDTVDKAISDGYTLDQKFYTVLDGEKTKETVDKNTVYEDLERYVVIINEATMLQVKGSISYVSNGAEVTGEDTVKIVPTENEDGEKEPVYVIYE